MKNFYYLALLSSLYLVMGCKKTDQVPKGSVTNLSAAQSINDGLKPLTVITLAGSYRKDGSQDGIGEQARFDYPHGIDLADDGSLYVADLFNNAIRKVTTSGLVTTLKVPTATDGQKLKYPEKVLVTKDGTISILTNNSLSTVEQHKFWIIKPSGELLTPASQVNYYTYGYFSIAKDPFSNFLQISGQRVVTNAVNHRQGFIESAEIVNNVMGQHPYTPPLDSLNSGSREYSQITQVYYGYNGVKYIVFRG